MNSVPRSKVIERRARWGKDCSTWISPSITGRVGTNRLRPGQIGQFLTAT